jgi:hypothetical protein
MRDGIEFIHYIKIHKIFLNKIKFTKKTAIIKMAENFSISIPFGTLCSFKIFVKLYLDL